MTTEQAETDRIKILMAKLGQLAIHYYRPDFTEGQARLLIRDYVNDLAEFDMRDIDAGITAYRRDPKSKFFPAIGQLREQAKLAERERLAAARSSNRPNIPQFGESRPTRWWQLPKTLWNARWRESEVPYDEKIRDVSGGEYRWPVRRVV